MRNQKKGIKTVEDLLRYYDLDNMRAEKVLYNNPNGDTGAIKLEETAVNFDYIEIFFKSSVNKYSSVKVFSPNGKIVNLMSIAQSATYTYIRNEDVQINGKSIIRGDPKAARLTDVPEIYRYDLDWCYIVRVVGYK